MVDRTNSVIDAAQLFRTNTDRRLNFGGGDGTSGGMEARVAKLEASVEHIQKDISEIKTDVREFRSDISALKASNATLTERVAHLPSKGFIVAVVTAALVVIAALMVFQTNIQNYAGTAPKPPATAVK